MKVQSAPASVPAAKASPWNAQVRPQLNGRFRVTSTDLIAIGMEHPDRVLDADLWGRPSKVLLLDHPLKLGSKVSTVRGVEFELRRIRLHELPGWPPRMASSPAATPVPALMDCSLRSTTYEEGSGTGQESVELVLEHSRKTYHAWLVGCPIVLLKCVVATLNQETCVGKTLSDLQDMPIIGPAGE